MSRVSLKNKLHAGNSPGETDAKWDSAVMRDGEELDAS